MMGHRNTQHDFNMIFRIIDNVFKIASINIVKYFSL
jgi:hypothetical protein